MEEFVKLAEEKGYNRFHPDWFINNKLEPATWYLELCLLQKWLREVHEMWVIVTFDSITYDVSIYGKYALIPIELKSYLSIPDAYCFTTYEQALEEGLKQALNLIK